MRILFLDNFNTSNVVYLLIISQFIILLEDKSRYFKFGKFRLLNIFNVLNSASDKSIYSIF